ncbi:hypothetical protein AB0H00_25630 [Nocardia sp. NPDC023852]|uniref:hypothetical protein n=1 Tax=Nocardia sp. NPDC023852 TaxID=3154697 RepID=UPI0033F8B315
MAPTEYRHTPPRPSTTEATGTPETPIVWPDPSPLDAWWRHIMHVDRPRHGRVTAATQPT